MPKKIEKLYLEDLKAAFRIYLDAPDPKRKTPTTKTMRAEWGKFWSILKRRCAVVDSTF